MLRDYYNLDDSTKLDLDRAISSLAKQGAFSDQELIVLKLTTDGVGSKEIARVIEQTVSNVNYKIIIIADKISEFLGDEYKDEKLLKEVETRLGRPLTPEEEVFCWQVIKAGHPLHKGLSIFNFKVGKNGRIVQRAEGEAEGQMDVQALWKKV